MNYFPNSDEEKNLIKFIAKYQYLHVSNLKYFFKSKKYYHNRVNNLINKKLLKKIKLYLVLDETGIAYANLFKFEYTKLNRNQKYLPRLLYISEIASYYYNSSEVQFTASFNMKDKQVFTTTSRKFVGVFTIDGVDYLTYHISEENDNKYIKYVLYDIQKEQNYQNIIIFVNDINRIKLEDFAFGKNQVLIIEENETNREKLKYIHRINWSRLIDNCFWGNVYLSEYNFCDYTDNKKKYISTFYFLDTEKINRISYFLRENNNKNIDIICNKEIKDILYKRFPKANYIVVDLEKYIEKERNIYD